MVTRIGCGDRDGSIAESPPEFSYCSRIAADCEKS
jgi:hypothetical protein